MCADSIERHYPIPNLNFRDFWDICSHYLHVNPQYVQIAYTIDGDGDPIVSEETDVAVILRSLSGARDNIHSYIARFHTTSSNGEEGTELTYYPRPHDLHDHGLYLTTSAASKLTLYKFEDLIFNNYDLADTMESSIEFGHPCEILVSSIDMRGFSTFCEQPNIESPYLCGLMSSFYNVANRGFSKYPPDLIKFAGDGYLAIWQTGVEDRKIAIDVCVEGTSALNSNWQIVRQSPHFTHGAPEEIGAGISFGLASKLSFDNDYIGRPINIASRLCGVCPGGEIYIDKSVPSMNPDIEMKNSRARIKSYGEYNIWIVQGS
jgi:class 3 adenylate cyclase